MNVELGPGAVVAGRYRLDRLLGRGGMGQVWAVTHEVTHRVAALKLLNGPVHLRADRRRRFLREARAASAVNHPNVVRVHDFFELEDGTPVMLMDLLEGETLGGRLAREGSLSLEATANILLPVISAAGTAHARGIVHRDLKPDNVFLARSESGAPDVRVLDFGVAKLTHASEKEDSDALTGAGGVLGTPSYMSPEQSFGEGTVDHRADIWSLGVVLYEALSGSRPVDGANVGQVLKRLMNEAITPIEVLVPELPADVAALVGSMLRRDPDGRPRDLREVHDVLSRYATVKVPAFDAAVGEAPPPLDSSPNSGRPSSRAVIHVGADSDPVAATHAAESTGVAPAPSFGPDTDRAQVSLPPKSGTRLRVGMLALALVGVLAVWRFWPSPARPQLAEPEMKPAAPSPTPPATPAIEPPPEPAQPAPSVAPEPTDRAPRRTAVRPPSAPPHKPEVPTPAPGSSSPRQRGLVDEPPF